MFATLIKYVHFVVREPSSFFLSFFNRVVSTLLFHSQRGWRFHVRRPERQLELEHPLKALALQVCNARVGLGELLPELLRRLFPVLVQLLGQSRWVDEGAHHDDGWAMHERLEQGVRHRVMMASPSSAVSIREIPASSSHHSLAKSSNQMSSRAWRL